MNRPTPPTPSWAVAACLALTVAVALVDPALPPGKAPFVGLLVAVPLLAATLAPPGTVALLGCPVVTSRAAAAASPASAGL